MTPPQCQTSDTCNEYNNIRTSPLYTMEQTTEALPPGPRRSTPPNTDDQFNGEVAGGEGEASNMLFLKRFANSDGAPQVVFLCLIIALSFGSTIGVVPAVTTDRFARLNHGFDGEFECSYYSSADKPEECREGSNDAQDCSAFSSLASNMLTFTTSAVVGSMSDCTGRRIFLIFGLVLALLPSLSLVLLQVFDDMSPYWYYGSGALGGLINWIAIALSCLSDVLPKELRAPSFGLLLAGFSCGFALSPMLALAMSHFAVSVVAFFIILGGLIFAWFILPETLPAAVGKENSRRRDEEAQQQKGFVHLVLLRPITELSILNRDSLFRSLGTLAFFSGLAISGDRSLLIYYTEDQLDFGDGDVAVLFLIIGLLGIVVQSVVLKLLNERIGERYVVILSFVVGIVHNIMYGLAKSKDIIFIAVALSSFSGLSFPTISAIKSNNVDETEQGRVQGALYSVASLAAALGPLSLRYVYWKTKDSSNPGVMFLFGACLYGVATLFAYRLPPDRANSNVMMNSKRSIVTGEIVESLPYMELRGPDNSPLVVRGEMA